MGNIKSIEGWGFKIEFKAANPSDKAKIEAFINAVGFEEAQKIASEDAAIAQALEGHPFPEDDADLELWFSEMTPEASGAICQAFEQSTNKWYAWCLRLPKP